MNNNSLVIGSWFALAVAIISLAGVGLLAMNLMQMLNERAAYADDAAQSSLQEGEAAQLHALVRETLDERAALATSAGTDLLTAVNTIEALSASSTAVHITDAQADKSISGKNGSVTINVLTFTVHAEGSFASLTHVIQMLETVPLAASVQDVNITRAAYDATTKNIVVPWQLNVRMRFYTTATLST